MALGRLGVWASLDKVSSSDLAALAQRLERWGYAAVWVPETSGRDPMVLASWLLANTTDLVVATGIANLYARDPLTMRSAQMTLTDQAGARFLLGIGVSHAPLVEGLRHHKYGRPIEAMQTYLSAMKAAPYTGPKAVEPLSTIIAALGPRMLETARDFADGAHPYNVTPEHTAQARAILGKGKLLCPEQMVLAETDPAKARALARKALSIYLPFPNYANNWRRLGFSDEDLSNGGSDRFIDSIVAWGTDEVIRDRIKAHWGAGADHVCILALSNEGRIGSPPDQDLLERLAPNGR